jgi:hypothetical protein
MSPIGLDVPTVNARSTSAPRSNGPPVELGAEDAELLQRVAWETAQQLNGAALGATSVVATFIRWRRSRRRMRLDRGKHP